MFAKENRKLKFAELYKTITVTFFLFSNPMVEHIWIECVAPGYTKNETINDFKMTETNLKYTDFESNANIKGELIVFEFKMLSNEYEMYRIWASNALGEDSFSFNIEATGKNMLEFKYCTTIYGPILGRYNYNLVRYID